MRQKHRRIKLAAVSALAAFAIGGYALPRISQNSMPNAIAATGTTHMAMHSDKAVAVLHPTNGNKVHGIVTFTQEKDGLHIVANLSGLTPGEHGFHAHQYGDCSSGDGMSAGGHFNPENKKHGAPSDTQRHVGDFGNILADAHGNARYEKVDKVAKLSGKDSIVGRAIIIHAKADDLHSQPTGDAGARDACGVVGVAK